MYTKQNCFQFDASKLVKLLFFVFVPSFVNFSTFNFCVSKCSNHPKMTNISKKQHPCNYSLYIHNEWLGQSNMRIHNILVKEHASEVEHTQKKFMCEGKKSEKDSTMKEEKKKYNNNNANNVGVKGMC